MDNNVSLIFSNYKLESSFKDKLKSDFYDKNCFIESLGEFLLVCEYAGRICYNSGLSGKNNRDSFEYHKHIIESKHYSIYGHINFSVRINLINETNTLFYLLIFDLLSHFPRIYVRKEDYFLYLNISLRHVIEFLSSKQTKPLFMSLIVKNILEKYGDKIDFVNIFFEQEIDNIVQEVNFYFSHDLSHKIKVLDYDYFEWYTFEIETSRRIANELIRHNTEYAVSQESTRYVDVRDYPMIRYKIYNSSNDLETLKDLNILEYKSYINSLSTYKQVFDNLCNLYPNMNKKYIRGYSADLLPLGLKTRLVISFTKWQLEKIFEQRISEHADPLMKDLAVKIKSLINSN
ncbi:MAG: hypothetical protein KatS3mg068_1563 [Candidatus Sericytochromatia bacterium]|nr:MAG: hypothetical protein KatS3mg068_1563 [Candidatus Sericytochromatia bacterium]